MTTVRTGRTAAPSPTAGDHALVDPSWLAAHLDDPEVRVVEVDVSSAAYDDWHINGAVLWNIYQDLKDVDYRRVGTEELQRLVARSGIGSNATIVFYGYAPAMGYWLMKLHGHPNLRILNCSRDTWRAEGHPRTTVASQPNAGDFRLRAQDGRIHADLAAVRDEIGRPGTVILDVRSEAEYRGERFWPSGGLEPNGRAGHVPSAIHQAIDGLYDERGSFRGAADLRRVFSSIDLGGDDELVTYCTIGGRAATAWFVLSQLLGREPVRVYDGSWAEWGRTDGVPVEGS